MVSSGNNIVARKMLAANGKGNCYVAAGTQGEFLCSTFFRRPETYCLSCNHHAANVSATMTILL